MEQIYFWATAIVLLAPILGAGFAIKAGRQSGWGFTGAIFARACAYALVCGIFLPSIILWIALGSWVTAAVVTVYATLYVVVYFLTRRIYRLRWESNIAFDAEWSVEPDNEINSRNRFFARP